MNHFISTHILDTFSGQPAPGVKVSLELNSLSGWRALETISTNTDGRAVFQTTAQAGEFRMQFEIGSYFSSRKIETFYTVIPVVFCILDATRKYHVPLLVSPYGYNTYRGS